MAEVRIKNVVESEATTIGDSLYIPRIINGLWQLAGGHDKEILISNAADGMKPFISAGLNCFDMADHYGDAELVIGHHNTTSSLPITAFTKWCPPEDGNKSFENAEKAIDLALHRLGQKQIPLLQYHIWDYTNTTYLSNLTHLKTLQQQGKILHLGVTNVDAAHLEMLLQSGFTLATNQVSCSVLDTRVIKGKLNESCLKHGVGLLCYGTLLGGFLAEKWLGKPEPTDLDALNWSLRKYLRFITVTGGWDVFQGILKVLDTIAKKHDVSIAAVATRHVLDIPAVKAVIVGTRLDGNSEGYIQGNLKAFTFRLDEEDRMMIAKAQEGLRDIPGDCGDEYRRPPFLTAAGDLSHHLQAKESERGRQVEEAIEKGQRVECCSGGKWEPIAGYCRAVRVGTTIHVSGTTAHSPVPALPVIGGTSAGAQTVRILDIIEGALKALGSCMKDVVRTRVLVEDLSCFEDVARAHGSRFGREGILPANTLVTADIVGEEMLVEIEAWAEAGSGGKGVLRIENF